MLYTDLLHLSNIKDALEIIRIEQSKMTPEAKDLYRTMGVLEALTKAELELVD